MTNKVMRGLSIGATIYVLLIIGVLSWGPLSRTAVAKPGLTIGFSVRPDSLVTSSELGDEIADYLTSQLSIQVKMRSFTEEQQLFSWLSRFREVDIAWLKEDFLAKVPAGELFPLVKNLDHTPGPMSGVFVCRQGLNSELRKQISLVFMQMNQDPVGLSLLAKLGTSRFVSSQGGAAAVAPVSVGGAAVPAGNAGTQDDRVASASAEEATEQAGQSRNVQSGAKGVDAEHEEPIALVADYLAYNATEDSYEAKGDVVLRQAGVELKSEQLLWQSATQDAAAKGGVRLKDAGIEISGESLQYNIATGEGQVRKGRVFVQEGNFRLAGEQVEKHGQAEYFVKNGSFTTCDGAIPDWKFSAREVEATVGDYARAKDVFFYVKDVPVLYAPYLMFPVKTERESGFLMPWFGYSNNKGARTSLAWYQVIDRHLDATIYLDYLSDVGLGKGLEYRYALEKQNIGKALYYHVTGFDNKRDLYYLDWEHQGSLPGKWRLTSDAEYANSKEFFEEFGEVAKDYNRDTTVATVVLQRNWQRLNLVGHARYIQDLETNNDETMQRLPEIGLTLNRYRLADTPFYFGLESYATRFWREEGSDGERLYLRPSLAAEFDLAGWLTVSPEVALLGRLYNAGAEQDEKFLSEVSLTLATRLVKSFDLDWGDAERIQHSIEPKIIYSYIPNESQDDLPSFDRDDRIEGRNAIDYALVNRLTARMTAEDGSTVYRELLNLRLSQSYDIDEARNNRSGEDQPFSDVRVEIDYRPSEKISLDIDGRIPVYGSTRFRDLSIGASARDDKGNAVKVDYTYKDEEFVDVATDYVRFQLDTPVFKPVYLRFEERYDFRAKRELEKMVGLEYRSKCWSMLLTYRNRFRENGDDDHEVMVNFILAGLSQNKGFGNGFDAVRQ